ncbi:MAG TPA: putative porin [Verrucomicrobiae bacterium]|nr:putative porin [Verrucomicrobiae bacterium]
MQTIRQRLGIPWLTLASLTLINGQAQSSDALIDKLVDKGILTVKEAKDLKEEADKGFTSGNQVKTGLPDWVSNLRVGGDFRGRFENFSSDDPRWSDRQRFRYRIRPGIFATLKDNFELGFRLTSSEPTGNFGGDPISGNTTFQDNASKKFVYIDLAYAKWTALNNALWSGVLTAGKMENPFVYSEMIFDADYTPEGFAQQFSLKLAEAHALKLNVGEFVLDEISQSGGGLRASRDPFMFGAQVRLESVWNNKITTSVGLGALLITSEEGLSETPAGANIRVADSSGTTQTLPGSAASSTVPNLNAGNTRNAAGMLAHSFNPWTADAAVTYTLESFPTYSAAFPIRLGVEYLNNPAADTQNDAYAIGITFGKSGKKGLWEISYRWKHLEADAWYEEVVDSDFGAIGAGNGRYFAGTNVEGHILKASYSPFDSLTLGVSYFFLAEQISGVPKGFDESIGRLQVDAIWKF